MSAVLTQPDDEGHHHPVAYESHKRTAAEQAYLPHVLELELLAGRRFTPSRTVTAGESSLAELHYHVTRISRDSETRDSDCIVFAEATASDSESGQCDRASAGPPQALMTRVRVHLLA